MSEWLETTLADTCASFFSTCKMLSNSTSECWFTSRLRNVIKFSITCREDFSSSWWLINSTNDKSNCQHSKPCTHTHTYITASPFADIQLTDSTFQFNSPRETAWNTKNSGKSYVSIPPPPSVRCQRRHACTHSISAAFHHFTHTYSPRSTPDVCCQICSPHIELKKIMGDG